MKNNKILMSLVLASISAMAAAPFVVDKMDSKDEKNDDKANVAEGKKVINVASVDHSNVLSADTKEDLNKQMDAMLMKKTSIQHLSESISILVDNYGHDNESAKDKIFKELNLAQAADSTSVIPGGAITSTTGSATTSSTVTFCHSACHGACHSACHGSRGWR